MNKCMCPNCIDEGIYKVGLDKRGNRPAYMCAHHYFSNEGYGRGGKNKAGAVGKARKKSYCFGLEFESAYTSEKARIEFLGNGFTPTNDGSLRGDRPCEYVSPLYYGMNSIVRYVKSIEKYKKSGDIKLNVSCGTHFHVSLNNMIMENGENAMEYLQMRRIYTRVFLPLSRMLEEDPERCKKVFGRRLNANYASAITEFCNPRNRYNFINVRNNNNIEFRVFKFRDAEQYTKAMWFARDVVDSIMRNFNSFDTMTEEEQNHKCDIVGQKICKKYMEI